MPTCILLGHSGSIGSYVLEDLNSKGYELYGIQRSNSKNIQFNKYINLIAGDTTDYYLINNLINGIKPDIFINCAGFSSAIDSFSDPEYVMLANATSVLFCLESIKQHSLHTKFINLSSAEIYKDEVPRTELTEFDPKSPYAESKIKAYKYVEDARRDGIFASNAVLFNTESVRKHDKSLLRKITKAAVRIKLGLQDKLHLGSLTAKRDRVHINDVVRAIYSIVTADKSDDFIVATGNSYSVEEIVYMVFNDIGLDYKNYLVLDDKLIRTDDIDFVGDASKIKNVLGWSARYSLEDIVNDMIQYEYLLET